MSKNVGLGADKHDFIAILLSKEKIEKTHKLHIVRASWIFTEMYLQHSSKVRYSCFGYFKYFAKSFYPYFNKSQNSLLWGPITAVWKGKA